jgi:hypothetical protein
VADLVQLEPLDVSKKAPKTAESAEKSTPGSS